MAESFPYEDIIDVPHHVSKKYPEPTMMERAARFHPFAAITGYEEMVLEAARTTETRIELDEEALTVINEKLNMLRESLDGEPRVTVTYFEPDKKKNGGAYVSVTGTVRLIDEYEQILTLGEDKKIPIREIYSIDGEIFSDFGFWGE